MFDRWANGLVTLQTYMLDSHSKIVVDEKGEQQQKDYEVGHEHACPEHATFFQTSFATALVSTVSLRS